MYIEQLDRPWLETPLPFQGFYIRNANEIQWIKDCCAYVYVDSGKSDSSLNLDFADSGPRPAASGPTEKSFLQECKEQIVVQSAAALAPASVGSAGNGAPAPAAKPAGGMVRAATSAFQRLFLRSAPAATRTDQQIIKDQVASANQTYERAQKVLHGVLDELRAGGELDVSAVEKVIFPVIDCVLQSTDAMACVIRMKEADDYTYNHSLATSIWSVVFGKSLGFDKPNLEILGMGGLLLDIGKTRISRELLTKTGPLEPEELAELRRHVEYGVKIISETKSLSPKVGEMVRSHHERHDGSGYPERLRGNDIPVFGRIAGLVDTYDAMTSLRPFAPAQSTYNVMRLLVDQANVLFQGELIERFIRVVGIFPTAGLVELNSGEVGIVVEQNAFRRLRPKVMLVLHRDKRMRSDFPVIDLGELPADSNDPAGVWIVHGLEPGSFGIDPREYYL